MLNYQRVRDPLPDVLILKKVEAELRNHPDFDENLRGPRFLGTGAFITVSEIKAR